MAHHNRNDGSSDFSLIPSTIFPYTISFWTSSYADASRESDSSASPDKAQKGEPGYVVCTVATRHEIVLEASRKKLKLSKCL